MAEEIKRQFTGSWEQYQDDNMPPFFDALGALEEEKQFLLMCHPQIQFDVNLENQKIIMTHIHNPDKDPDMKANLEFKLLEELEFQTQGHLLKVKTEFKDNKIIQQVQPINSHISLHTIELYIDRNKDLVQVYKVTDKNGKEVMGTRRYQKQEQTS